MKVVASFNKSNLDTYIISSLHVPSQFVKRIFEINLQQRNLYTLGKKKKKKKNLVPLLP